MKTSIDSTEVLMLRGTVGRCPDCDDERVLVPTDGFDGLCCTSCDAAVFALDLDAHAEPGPVRRLAG